MSKDLDFIEIFRVIREDILTLNSTLEELVTEHNNLVKECVKIKVKEENNERGLKLQENLLKTHDNRFNKMEIVMTNLQANIPKLRSFDYLPKPLPKVSSGTKL